MMLLVDSTLYVDWLRERVEIPRKLAPWIRARQLWICGVVVAEVLRGLVDARQKAVVEQFFDLLQTVPCDATTWKQTADLAWELDRQGKILPFTDLVIAACARRVEATVVTTDSHFKFIPNLTVRSTLPSR